MEGPAEKLGLYSQNEGENLSGSHMNMDVNSLPSLLCSGRFQILPKDLKIPVSQVRVEKWSCRGTCRVFWLQCLAHGALSKQGSILGFGCLEGTQTTSRAVKQSDISK